MKRDDLVELLLREELRIVNKHLPRSRKPLSGLLKDEYPSVLCRDGTLHFFRRSELENISKLVDEEDLDHLLLPIIITIIPESEGFIGMIDDKYAAKLVSKILGLKNQGGRVYLYEPHLFELRKSYSTIFQIVLSYSLNTTQDSEEVSEAI